MDYYHRAAVKYTHRWAHFRNPAFCDYEDLGGDRTSLSSQCMFAGSGVMDFTPIFGWYYRNANEKASAWTGVPFLSQFLLRSNRSPGPSARQCGLDALQPGDVIQLSFDGDTFRHTLVVVDTGFPWIAPDRVLVSAHSADADNRPLSSYPAVEIRCLHITNVIP